MPESPRPPASVVICLYNGAAVVPACLKALRASGEVPFELVLVDNASSDGSADLAHGLWPEARLIRNPRNLGFGSGNNIGIQAARGEVILLLNQDTEPASGWVGAMLKGLARDRAIGALGCKLLYPDGRTIQHAGGILFPNGLTAHQGMGEADQGQWNVPGPRTYVTAAAIAMRRAALEQVGLFDPGFDPGYFEEVDLQLRLWKAGWQVVYDPEPVVIHHESHVLGPGAPRTVALYTKHRLRYLAVNGLPGSRRSAVKQELEWLADIARKGRLRAALAGYAKALPHWWAWRAQRRTRRGIPPLAPLSE